MSYIDGLISALKAGKKDGRIKCGALGLGKTNLAVLNFLKGSGFDLVLRDTRSGIIIPEQLKAYTVHLGKQAFDNIDENVLFISPSVNRNRPEITSLPPSVLVTSDCEEFFKATRVPIFAVTGSDGKSTVTTLTSAILSASGIYAPAIGNIGTPYVCAPNADAYVTELSSFNLEYLKPKSFAAAITNITPNHLDFHGSLEDYRQAKLNILENTERAVLCYDDPESRRIISDVKPYAIFSTAVPESELRAKACALHLYTLENEFLCADGQRVISTKNLLRCEDYNLKNMLCSMALAGELASIDAIQNTLTSFKGLRHRCEHILSYRGVDFYNSSIDTSPTRAASTLNSLNRRVRLILGGRGKGLDPTVMREPILKYASAIALYGEEGEKLHTWLSSDRELSNIPHVYFKGFDPAVDYATSNLNPGDTVLLCPACTAYGEFLSFEERGERFYSLIYEKFGQKP